MTFSGRFLLSMIQFAVAKGADFESLISMTGHELDYLCLEDSRISSEVYNRVVEHCVIETEDPYFGLHAGEFLNLSAAGLIGQITQTSSNVKQALDYCCEFANLGCRALPMELKEVEEGYRLDFIPDKLWSAESPEATKQTIDGALAFTLREFHLLSLQQYYPLEVGLEFDRPEEAKEYERIFKCPIRFGQEVTYMVFKKEQVNAPVVTSNYRLLRTLVAFAEEKLRDLESQEGFYHHVRRHVMNMINPVFPTIEAVAANMNVSVRTLQRRLKTEHMTFKDVIESLKKELAFSYLKNDDLSIKEIADLLDYSDTSAFTRSFKKWTNRTPSAYRNKKAL
jgi:AraC-like DNA-binding protein